MGGSVTRHAEILATFYKGTTKHHSIRRIRFITPDVALVDIDNEVRRVKTMPGGAIVNVSGSGSGWAGRTRNGGETSAIYAASRINRLRKSSSAASLPRFARGWFSCGSRYAATRLRLAASGHECSPGRHLRVFGVIRQAAVTARRARPALCAGNCGWRYRLPGRIDHRDVARARAGSNIRVRRQRGGTHNWSNAFRPEMR
jgi:hypothetical protein